MTRFLMKTRKEATEAIDSTGRTLCGKPPVASSSQSKGSNRTAKSAPGNGEVSRHISDFKDAGAKRRAKVKRQKQWDTKVTIRRALGLSSIDLGDIGPVEDSSFHGRAAAGR